MEVLDDVSNMVLRVAHSLYVRLSCLAVDVDGNSVTFKSSFQLCQQLVLGGKLVLHPSDGGPVVLDVPRLGHLFGFDGLSVAEGVEGGLALVGGSRRAWLGGPLVHVEEALLLGLLMGCQERGHLETGRRPCG